MRPPARLSAAWSGLRRRAAAAARWAEPRSWLIILPLLAGLYFRVDALREGGPGVVRDDDGRQYYGIAASIKSTGLFDDPSDSAAVSAYRMPLYPYFLSLFSSEDAALAEKRTAAALTAVSLALIFVTYLVSRALLPNLPSLLLALLLALPGEALDRGLDAEVQGFYALFVAVFALCCVNYLRRPGTAGALLCGLSAGLALQVRSSLLAGAALCAALMWLEKERRKHLAVFLLALLVLLSPWALRNYRQFHRFILFEDAASAVNIYTATLGIDRCVGDNDVRLPDPEKDAFYRSAGNDSRFRLLKAEILPNLMAEPGVYLAGVARRTVKGLLRYWLLLPGIALAFYRRDKLAVFLSLFCLFHVGLHATMSVQGRYFFPMLPFAYILSAYWLYALVAPAKTGQDWFRPGETGKASLGLVLAGLSLYALQVWYLFREVWGAGGAGRAV